MGNSQKVKGYAQVEVRAMPKMCEKGYAQNPSGLNGNSQDVKGYAQVKVRAMPKCVRRAMPKSVRRAMPKNYKVQWAIAKRLRAMPKLK